METTLLATKLFIPPVAPGIISRPRLLQRLNGILSSKLTLVSAPAGFGKTTLLTQWVQDSHVSTAWLSLEESENDPVRFWEYIIASVRKLHPAVGENSISLLRSPEPVADGFMLTPLINDLSAISEDFVLVLDDYHSILSDAVHKGTTFLLDHLPPKVHLCIGTRADPPLPLARFRGKGMLTEIRGDDLRFSSEETGSLLAQMGVSAVSAEDIKALSIRAEGWIAGLKMAALSLSGEKDIPAFVAAFSGSQRYIMDYLLEEVLQKQSPEVYDFLLKTSVLERLNGYLCDAVTGSDDGREMLLSLERANLFLTPLDASKEWYRYHTLFRDLLIHRLKVEKGDERVRGLHLKACKWYEANGLLEDAIYHALEARDWGMTMELTSNPAVNLPNQASLKLLGWLRQIPEELLRTHVQLYMNYVWAALAAGLKDTVDNCLRYLDTVAEGSPHLQGRISVIRSQVFAQQGDYFRTEDCARRALSLLSANDPNSTFPDNLAIRGLASGMLGALYLSQLRLAEAEPLLREQLESSRLAGSVVSTQLFPLVWLGSIAFLRGKPHQAVKAYQEAIELAESKAPAPSHVCLAHLYFGDVYYEWNDLEKAAFHEDRAVELYRPSKIAGSMTLDQAYLHVARTRAAMGDTERAERALEYADRLLSESDGSHGIRARNAAHHAAIALVRGDTKSASEWVDILAELGPPVSPDTPTPVIGLLRARKGKDAAGRQLQAEYERFAREGLQRGMIGSRILQSLNSADQDDALAFITDALAIGKIENHVRTFVDFGPSLAPVLRQAISRGIEPGYARKLLDVIEAEGRQRRMRRAAIRYSSPAQDLLSEREAEVLRLVADGLSNQEIAKRLVVSLSTAKTHVHRLFGKLDAKDRLEAVTRAKELKLL